MEFRVYLAKHMIKLKDFADQLGIDRAYLSRVKNGHLKPSLQIAKHIELLTNGEVTVKDLLGE